MKFGKPVLMIIMDFNGFKSELVKSIVIYIFVKIMILKVIVFEKQKITLDPIIS